MGHQKSQLLWYGPFNRPMSKHFTSKATPSTIWWVSNWTGAVSPTQGVCYWHIATLPRTACFRRYAILRKQELRLCWAVTAPYIWVSPRQATSQSCGTNIQITQVWTLKVLFLLVPTWRSVHIKWWATKWTLKDRDKGWMAAPGQQPKVKLHLILW